MSGACAKERLQAVYLIVLVCSKVFGVWRGVGKKRSVLGIG